MRYNSNDSGFLQNALYGHGQWSIWPMVVGHERIADRTIHHYRTDSMKLLLHTCVWGAAKKNLESSGHEVVWTGDWSKDPGDEEILARANNDSRILVTLDKDFGEIEIARGRSHSGILR